MPELLPLWGIIEKETAADFIAKARDAGVTRLIGPRDPDVVGQAQEAGMEVHPYVAASPYPAHGARSVGHTWSVNYISFDPSTPEARRKLDEHRPIFTGPVAGEPIVDAFAQQHPEYWSKTRDGGNTLDYSRRLCLSPLHPEVREDQVASWVAALTESKGSGVQVEYTDGAEDATQLLRCGYDEPLVEQFKAEYGGDPFALPDDDPEWLQFRASIVTPLLVEAKAAIAAIDPQAVFSATVIATEPDGYLRKGTNWADWLDAGALDEMHIWFREENDMAVIERQLQHAAAVVAGRVPLVVELSCYHAGSVQRPEQMMDAARLALANSADAVGIYRHHAVDQLGLWGTLAEIGRL